MPKIDFRNPFKPGAGHMPPYLAGRKKETNEFSKLLEQEVILENIILTGLRGVGKTVLLDTLKPLAIKENWLWVGTDFSESTSINEETMANRLLADISVVTSNFVLKREEISRVGFATEPDVLESKLNYHTLINIFNSTPGLISDKLKYTLEVIWSCLKNEGYRGVIFAYDEAQTVSNHAKKEQYPLSLLLDVFQSIQKKEIPFMLALTGLPILFPKLVDARTFTERMFKVVFLERLSQKDSKSAILKPINATNCPVRFTDESIDIIIRESGGYPYFIQFICKETYDIFLQKMNKEEDPFVPIEEIIMKLDKDFFAGRWAKATDRMRELLTVISTLDHCDSEFTVQETVAASKKQSGKPFGSSQVNQMLGSLTDLGLIYKNRHGKYSFAVPLLGQYIQRQTLQNE